MPGPVPEHPRLRLLRGDPSKGKTRRRGMPPEPARGDEPPRPPKYLKGRARQAWVELAPELHRLGLLTVLDVTPFAVYCAAVGVWHIAEDAIEAATARGENTMTTKTTRGERAHPLRRISAAAAADILKFGAQFGLTPAARLRLSGIGPPDPPSKFGSLLAGGDHAEF